MKAKDARRRHQGQVADVFQMLLAVKGYPKMTGSEYTKDLSIITRITTKKVPKSVSRTLTIGDVTLISRLREEKNKLAMEPIRHVAHLRFLKLSVSSPRSLPWAAAHRWRHSALGTR